MAKHYRTSKAILMVNVGDDPKVNQINDTAKVARYPLASNEVNIDKEGNEIQKTQWHTIVVLNKVAGIIEEYVRKGGPIYVEGKIPTSTNEEKESKNIFRIEIHCDNFL